MGWKDDARRTVIGEWEELSSLPGYKIRPKKYSIAGNDEIQTVMREIQKSIDKKALLAAWGKAKEMGKDITEESLMDVLSEDEISALISGNSLPASKLTEVRLLHGIAEHNFEGSSVAELAHDILDYPDQAQEMVKIVEAFNAPLASRTSKMSETPPSGSTREQSSSTETPSQTDETLPS